MPVSEEVDIEVLKAKARAAGAFPETVEIVFGHPLWARREQLMMNFPSPDVFAEIDRVDRAIIEALGQQGVPYPRNHTQFLVVITSPYYEPR
ncbi:hypothetical protein A2160_04030 [Candidatus Beckwithbacteria bacterium RBG_13_42_9]|uniref:Uncharacterized protein n=1 Tax=Candidatus Beckwithbacteria bacterium RBG_13_42_9 TaxID=1797457 RepID=A0A1F5E306_9BACT|nr:MAG: hypothetical protein A2160_04030 [Candidatus Beckwithbacteria bacterium RBG_13_42_9]